MTGTQTPLDDMPLLGIEEDKPVPRTRVKGAAAARAVFTKMRDDDLPNAFNRALQQAQLDGGRPWDSQELADNGFDIPNFNSGGTEQQLERAMAPYYRLAASPEHAVKVHTRHGAADAREDINQILSEEITTTLRTSPTYTFNYLLLVQLKVKFGLGVAYHPDDVDWRFKAAGLEEFFFDRQKFVCEDEQEVVCATAGMKVTELYSKVSGESTGKWNKDAVMAAITKASEGVSSAMRPELLAAEVKNNDVAVGMTAPEVRLVHMWVEEFDGTITHVIFPEGDTSNDDFLYLHNARYKEFSEVLTLFPDGLGTNAKIHGVRGLLFKIFFLEHERNKFLCRFLAAGELGSSLILQAKEETSYANIGLQHFGPLAVLPHGVEVGQVQMGNLMQAAEPAVRMMERLRADRVAGYTTENVFDGDQRKTKAEINAHLGEAISLSESQVDLHYLCEDRLSKQTVRRMIRKTYVKQDPGGKEIVALHERLMERDPSGELLKAFFAIDWGKTRAGRAIGDGSSGKRTLALQHMDARRGTMDDAGRHRLDRWVAIDQLGSAAADELYPPGSGPARTTPHDNIAEMENTILLQLGQDLDVKESDPHLTHLRVHVGPLMEMFEAERQGQILVEEMAVRARTLWLHSVTHMEAFEAAGGDEASMGEAASIKQFLQQVGEPIENGLKRAQAMAEQEAAEGGEQEGGPDAAQIAEVEKHNEEMARSRERFDLEQAQADERFQKEQARKDAAVMGDQARKDAAKAAEILRDARKQAALAAKGNTKAQ
ncbi:MAG: hypothetical protein WC718_00125 [Phycisphaerales bacterium]